MNLNLSLNKKATTEDVEKLNDHIRKFMDKNPDVVSGRRLYWGGVE